MAPFKLNTKYLESYIAPHEMEAVKAQAELAAKTLEERSGAGNDFLGWLDLPVDYDKDELKANAEAYLEGVTFHYGELLFGDSIVKSDLENEIKEMFEGILSFRINTPTDDIISPTNPQNVLTKGTINITVKYI